MLRLCIFLWGQTSNRCFKPGLVRVTKTQGVRAPAVCTAWGVLLAQHPDRSACVLLRLSLLFGGTTYGASLAVCEVFLLNIQFVFVWFFYQQDNLQGYKTQNKFLNKEILELSALRRNAEAREREWQAKVRLTRPVLILEMSKAVFKNSVVNLLGNVTVEWK